jgi:hypothetical protein
MEPVGHRRCGSTGKQNQTIRNYWREEEMLNVQFNDSSVDFE